MSTVNPLRRSAAAGPVLALMALLAGLTAGLLGAPLLARAQTQAQDNACGPIYIRNFYGPVDYRTGREALKVVEDFHFTPEIEAGLRGRNGPIGGDINYTLKASPNHHRALITLMQVSRRMRSEQITGLEWPLECYFERGIRFKNDDPIVRMLYAQYLGERKRNGDAIKQLDIALELAGDNPFTHYNIGMLFADLAEWDRALKQAHTAVALGFPRPELAERLRQAGRWSEPPAAPAGGAAVPLTSAATPASPASQP